MSDMQVQEIGAGAPLVLVHGSPANAQSWRGVAKPLAERFRVVLPTLLGFEDEAGAPDPAVDIPAQAAALAPILARLGPDVFVAGHSYGGAVAFAAARQVPARGLLLLEPVLPGLLPGAGRQEAYDAGKATLDRYQARHADGDPNAVQAMVEMIFGPGMFEAMPPPLQSYLRAKTPANVRDVAATLAYRLTPAEVAAVAAPVTVAAGTRTSPFVRAIAEALAAARGGEVVPIEGANHAMLTTHAAAVAALVERAASV